MSSEARPDRPEPAEDPTPSERRRRASLRTVEAQQLWGPPLESVTPELVTHARELQAELVGLATDVRRGPLERQREEAAAYLGELRREFLRHHRRLVVHTRSDDREHVLELIRTELAELNERLRTVVLSRSSRLSQDGWRPSRLLTALERAAEVLPAALPADYEPESLHGRGGDSAWDRAARAGLRARLALRRLGGTPKRVVPFEAIARYHLSGMPVEQLEGLAALFVQVDMQLVSHSRLILEGMHRGFDVVREHAQQEDLQDVLVTFRVQVEDELAQAERELTRLVDDGARRANKIMGEAMKAVKADLPVVGTFELPARRRRPERVVAEQRVLVEDLETRMRKVRETIAASHVLLGLHLELASFRARARVVLGRQLSELRKDVRGRSYTQVERVIGALDEAVARMKRQQAGEGAASADDLRSSLEPLERVLGEALRNANQLLEQLTEEQLVAPLLEALNREGQALTDRYRVPAGRLPYAEWKLPAPLPAIEVRLAELVTAYIQTDVAPELLQVTHAAVGRVQPVVSAFHDLERVVTIDAEQLGAELDQAAGPEAARGDLRDVALNALERSRPALEEVLATSDTWSEELAEALKLAVLSKVDALRSRLSEGEIDKLRGRGRGAAPPAALTRQVDRLTGFLNRLGMDSARAVRRLAGEQRLMEWRRRLGLPEYEAPQEDVAGLLAPPTPRTEIPLFYRRLFAPNAHWAGDLLPEIRSAVEQAKGALTPPPGAGLRAVAVISADGSGQGALLAALTRGERMGPIRRLTFNRPVELAEVDALFKDVGQGQLVVVGGFRWLLSARPHGFEPLRRFLAGVLGDAGRNAWVLEASTLVWRYACLAAPVGDVFHERIEVRPLTSEELASAIMSRHQLSGLTARFSGADETPSAEAAARERFFAGLHRVSGGLLVRALPAWIASIAEVREENGVVRLAEPPPAPEAALNRLDDETLVILQVILRQGWIDAEAFAHLFRLDGVAAEGRLVRLTSEGLLERKSGGIYQVQRHLRHWVQDVLRRRGWLT